MIRPEQLAKLTCRDCKKRNSCKVPCVFVDKLTKGSSCRELIPPPDQTPPCESCKDKMDCLDGRCPETDYNMKVMEVHQAREGRKQRNIKDIREINDTRIKAIAALLYASFRLHDIPRIVELLSVTERRLYQIIKGSEND